MSVSRIYRRYDIETIMKCQVVSEIREQSASERYNLKLPNGKIVYRIRIVGTVVLVVDGKNDYRGILVDDGSGSSIWVKSWKDNRLSNIGIWNYVDINGSLSVVRQEIEAKENQTSDEGDSETPSGEQYDVFIRPEAIKIIKNPNWLIHHKLELIRMNMIEGTEEHPVESTSKTVPAKKIASEEKNKDTPDKTPKKGKKSKETDAKLEEQIMELIRKLDEGNGVKNDALLKAAKIDEQELDTLLFNLLLEGKVYEPKSGHYRIL